MQQQMPGRHAGLGMVKTEKYHVPDKMVGHIIGKWGERIKRLEAYSGCKVQIAPDNGELPDRPCSLTGSPNSISLCKQLIQQIIDRFSRPHMDRMDSGRRPKMRSVVEMSVPGSKVGLVIGTGGKTIRQLEERASVKLLMIRDSYAPTLLDQPLLIIGEPFQCQLTKQMVLELMAEKDMHRGRDGPDGMEIPVPRQAVGLVIGKGGETVKKIETDTGAKVQFKPDDGQSEDRLCAITGSLDQVQNAISMIHELLANANFNVRGGGGGGGFGVGHDGGPGRGCEQFDQYGQPNQPHQQYVAPQDWNAYGIQYQLQPSGPTSVSPAINPQTGQPDYSAAWAEYYRQQGMYHQANMILQQVQANAAAAVAGQPQQQQAP